MVDRKAVAGIDAGGTSFKCALALPDGQLLQSTRIPTTLPSETLPFVIDFLRSNAARHHLEIKALGIAAFGPIDVDPNSPSYGTILNTPKKDWSQTDLRSFFAERLDVPVIVDTDVNGALAAEMKWGAAHSAKSAVYVTVGTGIGAGIFANGTFIGKPGHPEFGHIFLKRHLSDSEFSGVCPFHGDCLEGLASGPAMKARFGDPETLSETHEGWDVLAFYLAQACHALTLSFRPERIILGGGMMSPDHLLNRVHRQYKLQMNDYISSTDDQICDLIVAPGLGGDAGLMGGIALGLDGLEAGLET